MKIPEISLVEPVRQACMSAGTAVEYDESANPDFCPRLDVLPNFRQGTAAAALAAIGDRASRDELLSGLLKLETQRVVVTTVRDDIIEII